MSREIARIFDTSELLGVRLPPLVPIFIPIWLHAAETDQIHVEDLV